MYIFVSASLADVYIGKPCRETLPSQVLMEMVIDGIKNKDRIRGLAEEADFTKWCGVSLRDGTDDIQSTYWNCLQLEGTLRMEWLPPNIDEFSVFQNFLSGEIHTESLPRSLVHLLLQGNEFQGTLDLAQLPPKMTFLSVSQNSLHGSLDLIHLPETLESLFAYSNSFSGTIRLDNLPSKMKRLNLHENSLSGPLSMDSLPESLQKLYLQKNCFSGKMVLGDLPKDVLVIDVSFNENLMGDICLTEDKKEAVLIDSTGIKTTVKPLNQPAQ
uniref:Leucine-rich repeat protein n=1 Tax=Paramoeba aestuarina TaxID=180227 RepID=A0A7S4JM24_9EUKA|mmetsp:Transcript_11648/g.17655  ORF Transcript_11648/g.17655 Transcript_11648/m.17655 type:complete len:271 (+) Transcript_11648:26-838(+)